MKAPPILFEKLRNGTFKAITVGGSVGYGITMQEARQNCLCNENIYLTKRELEKRLIENPDLENFA